MQICSKNIGCYDYNGLVVELKGDGLRCTISGTINETLLFIGALLLERGVTCKGERSYTETTLSISDVQRLEEIVNEVKGTVIEEVLKLLGIYQLINDVKTRFLILWNIIEIISSYYYPRTGYLSRIRKIMGRVVKGEQSSVRKLLKVKKELNVGVEDLVFSQKLTLKLVKESIRKFSHVHI